MVNLSERGKGYLKGPLAWMAENPVAANLIMIVLIVGGIFLGRGVKQEVFPEFNMDMVSISVAYPGASPTEVEEGVLLAIEEAVQGLDGVKEVSSTAAESVGAVTVSLLLGTDQDQALSDVRSAVDRITSFPEEIERPVVSLISNRSQAIGLVIYGDVEERTLRNIGNEMRSELLTVDGITLIELDGIRPLEISVEVPQENLRRYGLTLDQVAGAISRASIDLPSGGVDTDRGELLIRVSERRERGWEFEDVVILSQPDGTQVRLSDIATVDDSFRDNDLEMFFNGTRAVRLNVFRVGDQTPIEVSDAVLAFMAEQEASLPPGVQMSVWSDSSEIYRGRVELLLRNAAIGLVLVLVVLGFFLELKLAFWVMMGIPISFLGAMLILPAWDVSINMISLFAFILTLGIVVDDAIIVGEAVYKHRMDGKHKLKAAIDGVREVAMPVTFSVLTTMVFFMPLLFVPGMMGKFFKVIPQIALSVFALSLFESLFILPAHLAHSTPTGTTGFFGAIRRGQLAFGRFVDRHVERIYVPVLKFAVGQRHLTAAVATAVLVFTFAWVGSGRIEFNFMPQVESDIVLVPYAMPFGSPVEDTRAVNQRLVETAREVFAELGDEEAHSRGILSHVGSSGEVAFGPPGALGGGSASHLGQVSVFLVDAGQRDYTASEFVRAWRARLGTPPGVDSIRFLYTTGPGGGRPINIELAHNDVSVLEQAAERLALEIEDFAGVSDIDDGFSLGKEQLDVRLKPEARSLGITEMELARQLRASFFGSEADRQQRDRDEVRVYVRLPKQERRSEYDIESMMVMIPGGQIPLSEAATIERGRAYTSINRRNGRRVMNVTADVDDEVANANKIVADLQEEQLPALLADFPGLTFDLTGDQKEQAEVMSYLGKGAVLAFLAMFALVAVAFRSYVQPLIIGSILPFGFVGAVAGHIVMGFDLSLMSILGIVALFGIVVNDSLVLIVAVNRFREEGMTVTEALVAGGQRRFRPIILTSVTTFFGLMPMILETSVQAKFLVPMAISLGFGVLFATGIMLLLVPALYHIVDDIRGTSAVSEDSDEPALTASLVEH